MRSKERYTNWLALVDFLFNFTIAFTFLFIIAFLMIRPQANNDANVKAKAEFIMTMTWPDESFDDIDLWLQTPSGEKIWYLHKDGGTATLDRDDRGAIGDAYKLNPTDPTDNRKGLLKQNKEVITVRAVLPGRYVLAAHVHSIFDAAEGFESTQKLPYEAKLEVLKINPRVQTVANATVQLEKRAQQTTFVAFTVEPDGSVLNVELNPADSIVDLQDKRFP